MPYDLLIIGGGINGCAIAREASLAGLKVLLVEKDDLASHTSSASTKLIHGGLRYLETYEFRLVHEGLHERERLLTAAPHLIRPMTFVLPHAHALRPWWVVRAGLWLYDRLAGKSALPRSRSLHASDTAFTDPLAGDHRGFVYSDAWVDDSRLTLANALDAAAHDAEIATRTEFRAARRTGDMWQVDLSDGRTVEARALVNAAGPWVRTIIDNTPVATHSQVRLVKGSHIVVPRLFEGEHAYILQQPDRRIVFAIPYEGGFTEIGTTDVPVERPEDANCSQEEVQYLCDAVNRYFTRQIAPGDVVWNWSGVRPLHDDGAAKAQAVTRDYVLELDTEGPPLLSVFGGKITTARALAEEAMEKMSSLLGIEPRCRTRARAFPGGMIADFELHCAHVLARWPFLGADRARRMAHGYGTLLGEMLRDVRDEAGMGAAFGAGLTEVEARWMHDREWARTPEDALFRRSKLGLHLDAAERDAFARWWTATFA
ncbi:glycerol-3-phosphate dehydrogenase [Sphingomonas naasensis]|uniref:Glycerol-3-phosphate dehydrogenase n=1 Tax=Sphingomonas naasensis TaxID=1344951 RepID=A0A4S1WLQ6_9SPHN|nr:glycerol-3-phosphate dehydrogenase [Sphingomonas naasensis]NIJ20981.1 glycerol-3-phosphate dehydrogenase [Sphingomonas naasensis]TGX43365.1 glycerol-3-phosphate dehydrogenase [Sphingomonas naasensis]